MNTINANAAKGVNAVPISVANITSDVSAASSASVEMSSAPYKMPSVDTTASLAITPVTTAAPASHVSKPCGAKITDVAEPIPAK